MSFLSGLEDYIGTGIGNLTGSGSQQTNAANSIWQSGQFQPFSVNNPMGTIGFNGTSASAGLSPLQSQIQGAFGNTVLGNQGLLHYNPNTSFLPNQYNSIYGAGFQPQVNQQFSNLMNAQQPFINQYLNSNLTNEFSKGTLASTAGGYQTMGADQAVNNLMNQNMNTAFGQVSQLAGQRMAGAQGVAGLGEQQSEFGPSFANTASNSAFGNLATQGGLLNSLLQTGGALGSQRSQANIAAGYPMYNAAIMNDQSQSGFLNGLLFGGGNQGGLLGSLLGTGAPGSTSGIGAIGSALGRGISGVGSLFAGSGGSSGDGSPLGYQYTNTDPSANFSDPTQTTTQTDDGTTTYFGDGYPY